MMLFRLRYSNIGVKNFESMAMFDGVMDRLLKTQIGSVRFGLRFFRFGSVRFGLGLLLYSCFSFI